ncbi:MAG: histidinol phosphate phosphatase domain-containing protein [Deltaproteobacteria bacterium]|jgi:histidinol phosphatase-like PHP family hydrolase|nr:histidinol phosphate phosphatase domain-containing protein [Deltaproteobacteria bacterium]
MTETEKEILTRPVLDFHTHTLISDGDLGPAELGRRAFVSGYKILGLADHVDHATLEHSLTSALVAVRALPTHLGLSILAGVELTHVPPDQIEDLVVWSKEMGAQFVVVHGESPVEPVAPGTNQAAIEAGADILAHPGFLTRELAALAKKRGVFLELSARSGHSLCNGYIAKLALEEGANLMVNSDAHDIEDILTPERQRAVALGAGLSQEQYLAMMDVVGRWAEYKLQDGLGE